MQGFVFYRGPSAIDGQPIVAIITGLTGRASRNEKTGGIAQTWIMRADVAPHEAVKTGADASVCGACPHRGEIVDGRNVGRSCYVVVQQAPLVVFKAYKRGNYAHVDGALARHFAAGQRVRMGSYGDPAAVPLAVWQNLLADAAAHTGYTHQWARFPDFAALCMASCDTAADYEAATAAGWRTFRVRRSSEPTFAREVICPASNEAGNKTNCATCVACGGHGAKAKANIVIVAHGAAGKVNAFNGRTAA